MSEIRTIGLVLIIIGIVAFSYEGVVTYRTRDKVIDAGPVQVTADKTHKINLPPTLGALTLVGGVLLLVASAKRA
jgi:hypothetical protein